MTYQHRGLDGQPLALPVGKVVCVGRNYLAHIRELGHTVPETPILFMKPATALRNLDQPIHWPPGQGACHHEVELAVLLGQELRQADVAIARAAVAGYGIALDLTLRDLQNTLKAQGHPWEIAKAFDGSCPMSPFLSVDRLPDPHAIELGLQVNGELRQHGNTGGMIHGIFDLLAYMSTYFTLQPGDIALTGTPAGVGLLQPGDALTLSLADYTFTTQVA